MHEPVRELRDRIDDDEVPHSIDVRPGVNGGAVVVLRYARAGVNDVAFDLHPDAEGVERVDGEPDALEADTVLIELQHADARLGRPEHYVDAGIRYIQGIDPDREESGDYVHVSDYDNNDTRHPHHHLVSNYDRPASDHFLVHPRE